MDENSRKIESVDHAQIVINAKIAELTKRIEILELKEQDLGEFRKKFQSASDELDKGVRGLINEMKLAMIPSKKSMILPSILLAALLVLYWF